ncbi:MAG: hypothetical protein RSG59_01085 [Ruthenibacterium sp.]
MNRTEFLAALGLRLEDLPAEERDEAVKYYSEYLDEVGADGEDAAIAELGGAEKVANIIRANCGLGPMRPAQKSAASAPELTLDGPDYARTGSAGAKSTTAADSADAPRPSAGAAQSATNAEAGAAASDAAASGAAASGAAASGAAGGMYRPVGDTGAAGAAYVPPYTAPQRGAASYSAAPNSTINPANNRILWIIVIVCTFPLWIGLVAGVFGLLAGLFGAMFGLLVSGFSMLIAGLAAALGSLTLLASSPANALATGGLSLLAAGLGALLGGGMLLAAFWAFPAIGRTIGSFFSWLSKKMGGGHNA